MVKQQGDATSSQQTEVVFNWFRVCDNNSVSFGNYQNLKQFKNSYNLCNSSDCARREIIKYIRSLEKRALTYRKSKVCHEVLITNRRKYLE